MRRPVGVLAAASMFLFASVASAQDGNVLTLKASLKADHSKGKELTFVYVSGDTLYPDGTKITLALKAPDRQDDLRQVSCLVSKGRLFAEIGPWEQHFPPGRYRVVAEFRFEDQTLAQQEVLGTFRDMERCIMNDEEYAADYEEQNPVRAKMLKDYIARTKRCPGKTGRGETWLVVGSEQDADRAVAIETEHLRGTADNVARLARELAPLGDPGADPAALDLHAWREECAALDADLSTRRSAVVCTSRPEVSNSLSVALLNLAWCADASENIATGAGAELRKEIASLEALADKADRDDRRRLEKARTSLAALHTSRALHAQSAVEALSQALFGPNGLQPAPVRARAYVTDLLDVFHVKATSR